MTTNQSLVEPGSIQYRELFDGLDDPCVVFQIVDDEPLIVAANDEFRDVFVGNPVMSDIFGANLNEMTVPAGEYEKAQRLDMRTKRGDVNGVEIQRETVNGIRDFLYRGIPLYDDLGFGIYIDITQRQRRKEYVDVLQRVLRHNLRNDLSVIKGFAAEANELADTKDMKQYTQKILDKASHAENLTEKTGTIRDIINQDYKPDTRSLSVAEVAQNAADSCRADFPAAHVGVECTDGLTVNAGRKIEVALEAVIDNGLRYNNSDQPTVMVRGHGADENRTHVTIADNGVGIQSTEREIITGDIETSPLEHGSGLGLWATKWIVQSYEGSIDIHESPAGGTVVEFWLRR